MSYQKHIFLCINRKDDDKPCCHRPNSEAFVEHIKARLQQMDLWGPGKIRVSKAGCLGKCRKGPSLVIYPDNVWYRYTSLVELDRIIDEHLVANRRVADLEMPE